MDSNRVPQRLRHFMNAVEAFKNRRHEDDLRLLAIVALEFAAGAEVEALIGAAELNVCLEGY